MATIMTTSEVQDDISIMNIYEVGNAYSEYDDESDYNTHHRLFKYEKAARNFVYSIIESEQPCLIDAGGNYYNWVTPQEHFGKHWRRALDKMTLDELNDLIKGWMFIAIHRVY